MIGGRRMLRFLKISVFASAVFLGWLAGNVRETRFPAPPRDEYSGSRPVDQTSGRTVQISRTYNAPPYDPEAWRRVTIDPDAEFVPGSSKKTPFRLLTAGETFHHDEVSTRSGEKWLGLFVKDGRAELRRTVLRVETVRDEIVDKGKRNTGKSVSVDGPDEPIFLIEQASGLKIGPLKYDDRDLDGDSGQLRRGFNRDFDFGKGPVRLEVVEGLADGKPVNALIVRRGNQTQTLYMVDKDGDPYLGRLDFVGDFDRDGWPDFYMTPDYRDNVTDRQLYLSSMAKAGKIVRLVARFRTVGC